MDKLTIGLVLLVVCAVVLIALALTKPKKDKDGNTVIEADDPSLYPKFSNLRYRERSMPPYSKTKPSYKPTPSYKRK